MIEFDGKDLDDALRTASAALGRPVAELDYELVEGGRKGLFGLGARPVRIRISPPAGIVAPPAAVPDARPRTATAHELSAPARTLQEMIRLIGLRLDIDEARQGETLEIVLDGPDRKRLLAKDGELLTALETVLNRMGRRAWPDDLSVRLECPGFGRGRDDELIDRVREIASEVARSGEARDLEAMNAYERRIVHMTVRKFPGLTTISEGDGFLKRVRVAKIGT